MVLIEIEKFMDYTRDKAVIALRANPSFTQPKLLNYLQPPDSASGHIFFLLIGRGNSGYCAKAPRSS